MGEFDDPFGLARQSRPTGLRMEDGREIRLVGKPILALNPATNQLLSVAEYREHPWVADRYFYTLPTGLIDALVTELGEESFAAELLTMERALSHVSGDHTSSVGIWHEQFVFFQGLRPPTYAPFPDEQIRAAGLEPTKVHHALRTYEQRYEPSLVRFHRGYIGWLLTHQEFLDEHDQLLAKHAATVRRWGTLDAGISLPGDMRSPRANPSDDSKWQEFNSECEAFLARWRLLRLAGPYLPVPLQPLMAGAFPLPIVEQLTRAGGLFFLPDTMPIPSRDQLRSMLDDALHRGKPPEHLKEWLHMVRAGNSARNPLDRFARLFEIQHNYRSLNQRHHSALAGKIGRLEEALARFLNVSAQTIHADLIKIRERLGQNWLDRKWPI